MKDPHPFLILAAAAGCCGSLVAKEEGIRPGSIKADQLREYETLEPERKLIIDAALKLAAGEKWLTYAYGSSDPASGGLDCSGSMYYLMQQVRIDPPRTSRDQFRWVKESGEFTEVPATVSSLKDPAFANMKPGDLLFWSGTTGADTGDEVTHVQMFLGHEKADGLAVMVGSSDGRSYRGKRRDGYGVFDFKLPVEGSKARFLGYGPPEFRTTTGKPPVLAAKSKAGKAESPRTAVARNEQKKDARPVKNDDSRSSEREGIGGEKKPTAVAASSAKTKKKTTTAPASSAGPELALRSGSGTHVSNSELARRAQQR